MRRFIASEDLARHQDNRFDIEHPTGAFAVDIEIESKPNNEFAVQKAALIRTARLLMRGEVVVPEYALEKNT